MRAALLVGRVIVGVFYLFSASGHVTRFESMVAYAASKNVPLPGVAVAIAGILLAIAGLTILFGVYPKIGVAALVLFFVPVTLMMHTFWAETDPMRRTAELVNFTKNFALLGSALMFFAIPEPWPYNVRRPALRVVRPAPA